MSSCSHSVSKQDTKRTTERESFRNFALPLNSLGQDRELFQLYNNTAIATISAVTEATVSWAPQQARNTNFWNICGISWKIARTPRLTSRHIIKCLSALSTRKLKREEFIGKFVVTQIRRTFCDPFSRRFSLGAINLSLSWLLMGHLLPPNERY